MRIIAAHAYHRIDYEEVWVAVRSVPLNRGNTWYEIVPTGAVATYLIAPRAGPHRNNPPQ